MTRAEYVQFENAIWEAVGLTISPDEADAALEKAAREVED